MDFPTQKLLIFNSKPVTFVLTLNIVDNDLLAGMEPIDLSIIGELRLDSIDHICDDVTSLTNGFVWSIGKGLLGDLALDLVDNDLLAGMETIDLSIIGELRLDSIDHICADVTSLTNGFVWSIGKGLLGDLALDLVDNDLLAGMETIDLSIIGELRLDSIDHICADVTSLTNGFVWAIGKGLLVQMHQVNHQFTKKYVGFLFTFSLAFLYYCMYNFRMNIFWICRGFFE